MNTFLKWIGSFAAIAMIGLMAGCSSESEQAADDVEDAAGHAAEAMEDAAGDTADAMEDAADDAVDAVDDAVDEVDREI